VPYQLLVVGGGTAGLVVAAIASALGARTALIERGLMGGDCLNFGCVPSKALLAAARGWHQARRVAERFSGPTIQASGDFVGAMERMRRLRAEISVHDSPARFRDLGVDVYLGEAVFSGARSVVVDGTSLQFGRAVIATGTRPFIPRVPGIDTVGYLTNATIFSLSALPRRLVIVGGGPIGVELGQAFSRFGAQVTILEAADRILANDDPDAAEVVASALRGEGVSILCGASLSSVAVTPGGKTIAYRRDGADSSLEVDEILLACGRAPNVDELGLEAAGVTYDRRQGVLADERLRTTNPRIFAAGDVVGPLRFTHLADAHARIVVRNALFHGRAKASDLVVPWCTYTSPELAHVGLPFSEIERRTDDLDSITVPYADVDRARLEDETAGFLRIHLRRGGDRIEAATLVGANAGELVSHLTGAMQSKKGIGALGDSIYPYPTMAEIIRKAADSWRRTKLKPSVKRALGVYFRTIGR